MHTMVFNNAHPQTGINKGNRPAMRPNPHRVTNVKDTEPLAPYLPLDGECEDCPDNDKPVHNVKDSKDDTLLVPELDWSKG